MSKRKSWIGARIAFLLFLIFVPVRSRDGRTFQIDEALKVRRATSSGFSRATILEALPRLTIESMTT